MRLEAVDGDITAQAVDAIVNAANPSLLGGGGVNGAIHAAAGPALLDGVPRAAAHDPRRRARRGRRRRHRGGRACRRAGSSTPPGRTGAPARPTRRCSASCFSRSLEVAAGLGAATVAMPAVGAGIYGWDVEEVAGIAVAAVRETGATPRGRRGSSWCASCSWGARRLREARPLLTQALVPPLTAARTTMGAMLVAQLLAAIERLAPSSLAEEWDNVGLLVGRHNQPARRVLVALELRDEVLGEAREAGCDAVVTHHPPIFPTLAALTDGGTASELVLRAAEGRVAVIAAHTNLDAAAGGLNDVMAGLLGITPQGALVPSADDPSCGLGRVGPVPATTLGALVERVRAGFGGAGVTFAGDPFARVERLACCTGSGGSLIDAARDAEADAYVTSDLRYHDADRAEGLPLVCVPHARAERVAMKRWTKSLEQALAPDGVEVHFAEADTDPWQVA